MIRILIKAFILVCIILSIYFIVNPSACSNLINGRVVNSTNESFKQQQPAPEKSELLGPSGDQAEDESFADEPSAADKDNNESNATDEAAAGGYSQEEIDHAIANRYVELEREYTQKGMDAKEMAKEISYTVMDDFDLTANEWESFLARATASNLFEKVRQEYAQDETQAATAQSTPETAQ